MTCQWSGKRCFTSAREAKRACGKVGNRLRVYPCPDCGMLHVTKRVGK